MPATEQTWRDQKRLHVIFAATGTVMLIATIWMFAADHDREWKDYQRTANNVEIQMTDWRTLQFETNQAVDEHRRLAAELEATQGQAIPLDRIAAFKSEVQNAEETANYSFASLDAQVEALQGAEPDAAPAIRSRILTAMNDIIQAAKFREDTLLGKRKFKAADRDAAVATLGLLVRDGEPDKEQQAQQQAVDVLKADLADLTRAYQEAGDHRKSLESILGQITMAEDTAADLLDKNQAQLRQLQTANADRRSTYVTWAGYFPLPGKKWLELPIFDAFNSPRKIDNLWSDGLVIDYNFSKVRRFDRCTTCHQLMQKTMPGSADVAAYPQQRQIDLVLLPADDMAAAAPSTADAVDGTGEAADEEDPLSPADELEQLYGLRLAPEGLVDRLDVTVQYIRPESPAARAEQFVPEDRRLPLMGDQIRPGLLQPTAAAFHEEAELPGLRVGDVIVEINRDGNQIYDAEKVLFRLLDAAEEKQPLILTVKRGMQSPYSSHPRLDLFVGSLSPHKMSEFACSICHEGQGSATAFKWASHYPDSVEERKVWSREHGWFDNHHWIYPMYPTRFAEAACLKCHHEVTELEPSERFPDAPAPKVVRGYHLVRKYGCYGCHEVNGYDGPERVGPDMRIEPNVFAAALQLKTDPAFAEMDADHQDWVEQLIQHPERDTVRQRLYEILNADANSEQPVFTADTHTHLTPLFKDSERPGTLRKAGPSLRFAAKKMTTEFMADWIREPKHFRPGTRMPQFFGNRKHLDANGLEVAESYEPLEVLGLATFLRNKSQPFEYLEPYADTEAPSAERGRRLFEERGCLACHDHKDFPDTGAYRDAGAIVQGPDLSGVGDKLNHEAGRKWLYSWIREPTRYHARTVMPDLYLEPIEDADGNRTDPANDIVEYLLASSHVGWKPGAETLMAGQVNDQELDSLVLEHLKDVFSESAAVRYAQTGIPASFRAELKGAEVELLASADPAYFDRPLTREQKLNYIGGKTVAKYGCYGCHDIPGYEDSKPIGTGLADWGRKDPSKLAFEHIANYLGHGHGGHGSNGHGAENGHGEADDHDSHEHEDGAHEDDHDGESHGDAHDDDPADEYFVEQILGHHRTGFIYQKLREPRSYDYHKTENKKFNEWLRMPQFPFDVDEREAVMTFVLGLVADPPTDKYIFKPDDRRLALIQGQQVLDKYNCGGCHLLKPQEWSITYQPDAFGEQATVKTFPFLKTHFPPELLDASSLTGPSGQAVGTVSGMPALDDQGTPLVYDIEGDPVEDDYDYDPTELEFPFDLWEPTALAGETFEVGLAPLNLTSKQIVNKRPSTGGFLAKYLLPRVVAREKQVNPNAKGAEGWGWVPPPLLGEGSKVQTSWLHGFLLNPHPIRPAVVLRMPRFNMSPTEASQLVNYFAALENVEYPYEFSARRQSGHLETAEAAYRAAAGDSATADTASLSEHQRFKDAMGMVVNANYCVKCHLVGDYEPEGPEIAKAPDLSQVYLRLRPEYVRDWIANPKSILPYTSMPVNIPYDADAPHLGGVPQDIYHGTSIEQVDALVDLLMNYDEYTKQRSKIAPLVKEAAPPPGTVPSTATGSDE